MIPKEENKEKIIINKCVLLIFYTFKELIIF